MKPEDEFPLGTICTLYGCRAIVRFNGQTAFATGAWIGLELDQPVGKNDGSVQGQRYFDCRPAHGVFMRAAQLQKELQSQSAATAPAAESKADNASRQSISSGSSKSSISPPTSRRATGIGVPVAPSAGATAVNDAAASTEPRQVQPLAPVAATLTPPIQSGESTGLLVDRRATMGTARLPIQMVPLKDFEETKLKLKILEGKRAEDRERLKDYEKLKNEVEQLQLTKSKLSVKVEDCQRELVELKRSTRDSSQAAQGAEEKLQELAEQCELLTLDKEMAEERADALQLEVDTLKERVEELSLDLEVLQQEKEEDQLNVAHGEAPLLSSYSQLEKQNERLKEALIKLRDVSSAQDAEHTKRIRSLEKDLQILSQFKTQYEQSKSKLAEYEEAIDLLKEQLDTANENNDMIEQLTEQNLKLSEFVDQQKAIIQDLETDKELSEELEENHVQTEKELTAELEQRDAVIRDQLASIDQAKERNADYENTIEQFRQLTRNLQNDLSHLREKYQVTEDENRHLSSQSQTMLNLNLQLQTTAAKSTSKAIELEIRKLDAEQAALHLLCIQPYLPETFAKQDAAGINCLLLTQRLTVKCQIAKRFVDEINGSHDNAVEQEMSISLKQKLSLLSSLSVRLTAFIQRASVANFIRLGDALPALTPLEARIDQVLSSLKEEKSISADTLAGIQRAVSQLETLGDTFPAEEVVAVKGTAINLCDAIRYSCELMVAYLQKLGSVPSVHQLLSNCNSLKATTIKLGKTFEDLLVEGKYIGSDSYTVMQEWMFDVGKITGIVQKISQYIRGARSGEKALDLDENILQMLSEQFNIDSVDSLCESIDRIATSAECLIESLISGQGLQSVLVPAQPPWIERADMLKAEYSVNFDLEIKNKKMTEEIAALAQELRSRDESLQQNRIKIDLLESRMHNLRQQSDVVNHYEKELESLKSQERSYLDTIETLQHELESLESANKKLNTALMEEKKRTATADLFSPPANDDVLSGKFAGRMADFLLEENRSLKSGSLKRQYQELFTDSLQRWESHSHQEAERARINKRLNQELGGLIKEIHNACASYSVVDLTKQPPKGKWTSQKLIPEYQFCRQQSFLHALERRANCLSQKVEENSSTKKLGVNYRRLANLWLGSNADKLHSSDDRRILVEMSEFTQLHISQLLQNNWGRK